MHNAIIEAPKRPSITMSVHSVVYRGQNQIRRNVANTTSLYIGSACYDRVVDIEAFSNLEFLLGATSSLDVFDTPEHGTNTKTKCLHLDVDGPVRVIFDDNWELPVTKHLCMDAPVYKLTVFNEGAHVVRILMNYLI